VSIQFQLCFLKVEPLLFECHSSKSVTQFKTEITFYFLITITLLESWG